MNNWEWIRPKEAWGFVSANRHLPTRTLGWNLCSCFHEASGAFSPKVMPHRIMPAVPCDLYLFVELAAKAFHEVAAGTAPAEFPRIHNSHRLVRLKEAQSFIPLVASAKIRRFLSAFVQMASQAIPAKESQLDALFCIKLLWLVTQDDLRFESYVNLPPDYAEVADFEAAAGPPPPFTAEQLALFAFGETKANSMEPHLVTPAVRA